MNSSCQTPSPCVNHTNNIQFHINKYMYSEILILLHPYCQISKCSSVHSNVMYVGSSLQVKYAKYAPELKKLNKPFELFRLYTE